MFLLVQGGRLTCLWVQWIVEVWVAAVCHIRSVLLCFNRSLRCFADANGTASQATDMLPTDALDSIKFQATLVILQIS
jgi:hypothetical protein